MSGSPFVRCVVQTPTGVDSPVNGLILLFFSGASDFTTTGTATGSAINHVDSECRRTSVHSKENGVARPLQPLHNDLHTGHNLFERTCLDFLSDIQREELQQSKCAFVKREEYGLDPDIYAKE